MNSSKNENVYEYNPQKLLDSHFQKWKEKLNNSSPQNPYIAIQDHINEDTVTDLLAYIIVQYKLKKEFVEFLIKQIQRGKDVLIEDEGSIEFETQKIIKSGRIDLFIKFNINKTPSCIIFENKIFDAPDQPNQLKKYVDAVNNENNEVNKKNIFVFYVSSDGNKAPKNNTSQTEFHKLGFYNQQNDNNNTIYGFLNTEQNNGALIQYFCEYLEYMFSYSSSVNLFNTDNEKSPDVNELFVSNKYPSISERIYEHTSPDELKRYYLQLYKVHILNNYIKSRFKESKLKQDISYNYVFDGLKIEDTISIAKDNNQPITLETKYYRNNYFIVLSIYYYNNNKIKVKQYINKRLSGKSKMSYFECDDNKKNYSLWLWLPNEASQVNYACYTKYIDEVCECMMKLFNAFTEKKRVSIKSFSKLYNKYH